MKPVVKSYSPISAVFALFLILSLGASGVSSASDTELESAVRSTASSFVRKVMRDRKNRRNTKSLRDVLLKEQGAADNPDKAKIALANPVLDGGATDVLPQIKSEWSIALGIAHDSGMARKHVLNKSVREVIVQCDIQVERVRMRRARFESTYPNCNVIAVVLPRAPTGPIIYTR